MFFLEIPKVKWKQWLEGGEQSRGHSVLRPCLVRIGLVWLGGFLLLTHDLEMARTKPVKIELKPNLVTLQKLETVIIIFLPLTNFHILKLKKNIDCKAIFN